MAFAVQSQYQVIPIMTTILSPTQVGAITKAISPVRLSTYVSACASSSTDPIDLYAWNAQVSSAFLQSLQVCEVAVRNAISDVIEAKYGPGWPWSSAFITSLPMAAGHFKPRDELKRAKRGIPLNSTGKVIAELKFVFWCHMLTPTHHQRLWVPNLRLQFPNAPFPLEVDYCRNAIHQALDALRALRNRIAHHEPILAEPLEDHHRRLKRLISWRCQETLQWLDQWERVTMTLTERP